MANNRLDLMVVKRLRRSGRQEPTGATHNGLPGTYRSMY
jgi:hypothetical protein